MAGSGTVSKYRRATSYEPLVHAPITFAWDMNQGRLLQAGSRFPPSADRARFFKGGGDKVTSAPRQSG